MEYHIKTCPHCGGLANLYTNYSKKTGGYFVYVKCEVCGSQGKLYNSPNDPEEDEWKNTACYNAVKLWNMRI